MINLYGFGASYGLADPSPFVLKVDAYLRVTDIPFKKIDRSTNLFKAPKGKLPFIDDEGGRVADSYFILRHLEKKYSPTLDNWLTESQAASAHLISKCIEEHLYWCLVYSRWISDETWPTIKANFFNGLPLPVRAVAPSLARKGVRDGLKKQGLGRHTEAEIKQILRDSLISLSGVLGEKPYFLGDKVSSLDVVAYAFLSQFILADIDNSFNDIAKEYSNLVRFCHDFHTAYYQDASKDLTSTRSAA